MGAFHSGTDISELKDNADKYNYYISLVVDFQETYKCKIVFPAKSKIQRISSIKDTNGDIIEFSPGDEEETSFIEADLDVEIQSTTSIPEWIRNRYNEINASKSKKSYNKIPKYVPKTTGYGDDWWDSYKGKNFDSKKTNGLGYGDSYNKKIPFPEVEGFKSKNQIPDDEQFAMDIVMCTSNSKTPLTKAMADLETYEEFEYRNFIFSVKRNLEIFHYNIYKTYTGFEEHVKDALRLMKNRISGKYGKLLVEDIESELKELIYGDSSQ